MIKFLLSIAAVALTVSACNNESARYTDLQTGKTVKLEKDDKSGLWVDVDTHKPVYIYVDNDTHDTILGSTGKKINGKLMKAENGKYMFAGDMANTVIVGDQVIKTDNEMKVKDGDYKLKVDNDGDVKVKTGDKVTKIDGETGEKKVKKD